MSEGRPSRAQVWLMACRPATLTAAVSLALGSAAAAFFLGVLVGRLLPRS